MSNETDNKMQINWDSLKEKVMENARNILDEKDGYNASMSGEVCPPSAGEFFKKGFAKAEQEKEERRKKQKWDY